MQFINKELSVSRWDMKASRIRTAIETVQFAQGIEHPTYEQIRAITIHRLIEQLKQHSEEDVRDGILVSTLFAYGEEQEYELLFVDVTLCSGPVERLMSVDGLSYSNALIQVAGGYNRRAGDNAVMSVFSSRYEEELCLD